MKRCSRLGVREVLDRRSGGIGWILVLGWAGALSSPLPGEEPASASGHDALSRRVATVLEIPPYRNGHWGILVVDGKTGQTVYERNADQQDKKDRGKQGGIVIQQKAGPAHGRLLLRA